MHLTIFHTKIIIEFFILFLLLARNLLKKIIEQLHSKIVRRDIVEIRIPKRSNSGGEIETQIKDDNYHFIISPPEKNSSPLHGSMIAKITLSKILKMPLEKYVRYIERKFNGSEDSQGKRLSFYAKVITKNGDLRLEIADQRLLKRYPINETNRNAVIVKMINTRNELSEHIVGGILKFQKKFWESGKESDIKPSTFKQFLSLFPCHG